MGRGAWLLGIVALAGCHKEDYVAKDMVAPKLDVANYSPASREAFSTDNSAEAVSPSTGQPRIAYSYTVTYAFDRRTVAQVQGRQLAFCRQLGPARCVVMKSTLSAPGPDDHFVSDQATLLVDARQAETLNRQLDAFATAGGARLESREVEAEDVTRQVIDTDARVRAKQALAIRLLAIVQSGKGKVGELVEAERAYAATQEELDAARGEQADLAQRVAMSQISITYSFADRAGPSAPVRASLDTAGETLAKSTAALLTALVALLPWVLAASVIVALVRWLRRRMGWRWPRRAIAAKATV